MPAGPIGDCWVSQSWPDTAWEENSWGITIPEDLVILTTSLPDGREAVAYAQTLSATGGAHPYVWTLDSGTLPDGLTLQTTGVIDGTPTTPGLSSFVVKVTDDLGDTDTQPLTIQIWDPIPAGTQSPLGSRYRSGARVHYINRGTGL